MERDCSRFLGRLLSKKGGAGIKTLVIFTCLMLVVSFLFQVFMVYTTCNQVSTAVRRAVMSVASQNKPLLFDSIKEGNTYAAETGVVTTEAVEQALSEELGLLQHGNSMELANKEGGFYYRITELNVDAENISQTDRSNSLRFVATFTLTIPVAQYWDMGAFNIPMRSVSHYTSKY